MMDAHNNYNRQSCMTTQTTSDGLVFIRMIEVDTEIKVKEWLHAKERDGRRRYGFIQYVLGIAIAINIRGGITSLRLATFHNQLHLNMW